MTSLLSLLGIFLLPGLVHAAGGGYIYCGNLPGCGSPLAPSPPAEYFSSVLIRLATLFPAYAYSIGVLFIMIGGVYMLLSAGRDDWVSKGKTSITWAVIGIAATSFSQTIVGLLRDQLNDRVSGSDLVFSINNTLVSTIFDLLNISILGIGIYCGMWMVLSMGQQDQFNKARDAMFWCGVGAIVINLAWYIANAFATL